MRLILAIVIVFLLAKDDWELFNLLHTWLVKLLAA